MNIVINQQETTVSDNLTISELLDERHITAGGIAVAVNNRVVRKAEWLSHRLGEGDKVTIITAVCGG